MVVMQQLTKMKKIIIPLAIFSLLACNQPIKKTSLETSSIVNESITTSKELIKDSNPNCFTNDDIMMIRNHYKKLEKAIKSGAEYNFANSPIQYSDKDIAWLKRTLKKNICKGGIKEVDGECPTSIIYNIDCSETLIIDDEEHFSEQDYWDKLVKKDGKVIVSESGSAG